MLILNFTRKTYDTGAHEHGRVGQVVNDSQTKGIALRILSLYHTLHAKDELTTLPVMRGPGNVDAPDAEPASTALDVHPLKTCM